MFNPCEKERQKIQSLTHKNATLSNKVSRSFGPLGARYGFNTFNHIATFMLIGAFARFTGLFKLSRIKTILKGFAIRHIIRKFFKSGAAEVPGPIPPRHMQH